LEIAFGKYSVPGYFSYALGTIGAFLTSFYSARLLYLTFLSKPNGQKRVISFAYDSGLYIAVTLGCLAIPSLFAGYCTKDMVVGLGSTFFGNAIYVDIENMNSFEAEFIPLFYKTLPVNLSLLGVFSAFYFYRFKSKVLFDLKTSQLGKNIYVFFNRKWFFDKLYNEYLGQFFFKFGYSISYKLIDRGIFEILGPTGLSNLALSVGSGIHKMQTRNIYHYTLAILIGLTVMLLARQAWLLFSEFFHDYRVFILALHLLIFMLNNKL
jgi:NADH-ubiquinone oxidoreductase chain 5